MQLGFWTFMWRCLDRAATLTAHFFGLDLKTVLVSLGLVVLGFLIHSQVRSVSETKEEVVKYFILIAGPYLVFITALILLNIIRAPYLVYAEEYGKATTTIGEKDKKIAELESRMTALENKPATSVPIPHILVNAIPSTSRLGQLTSINRNLPKGDRDRFADALYEFSSVLDRGNELFGKLNLEGGQLAQGWRNGQIAKDYQTHKRVLSEIDQSAREFAKTFPQTRIKWKYFAEQTAYIFGDNPDNEGPNALINAAELYSNNLERWILIPSPTREQRPILDLLEPTQNQFDAFLRTFSQWRQGCDSRLNQMKDSIK